METGVAAPSEYPTHSRQLCISFDQDIGLTFCICLGFPSSKALPKTLLSLTLNKSAKTGTLLLSDLPARPRGRSERILLQQ